MKLAPVASVGRARGRSRSRSPAGVVSGGGPTSMERLLALVPPAGPVTVSLTYLVPVDSNVNSIRQPARVCQTVLPSAFSNDQVQASGPLPVEAVPSSVDRHADAGAARSRPDGLRKDHRRGLGRDARPVAGVRAGDHLVPVAVAVAVGVGLARVGPGAVHLDPVAEAVSVGVRSERICPGPVDLRPVAESVAVGIGLERVRLGPVDLRPVAESVAVGVGLARIGLGAFALGPVGQTVAVEILRRAALPDVSGGLGESAPHGIGVPVVCGAGGGRRPPPDQDEAAAEGKRHQSGRRSDAPHLPFIGAERADE